MSDADELDDLPLPPLPPGISLPPPPPPPPMDISAEVEEEIEENSDLQDNTPVDTQSRDFQSQ